MEPLTYRKRRKKMQMKHTASFLCAKIKKVVAFFIVNCINSERRKLSRGCVNSNREKEKKEKTEKMTLQERKNQL